MSAETRRVSFETRPVAVIGILHLPHGFDESRIYPAIVIVTPGSSVKEEMGVPGICAGGGYAVKAALTERRIKAVGTVVPVNSGRASAQ